MRQRSSPGTHGSSALALPRRHAARVGAAVRLGAAPADRTRAGAGESWRRGGVPRVSWKCFACCDRITDHVAAASAPKAISARMRRYFFRVFRVF